MAKRSDEVKVGLMVVGTGIILLVTFVLMMNYNPFRSSGDQYNMQLMFAGGLEKDAVVRLAGLKCGKVTSVRLNSQDATAVEIVLRLNSGTPVRTDSVGRVASLGPLDDNYIEIGPGLVTSPLLQPGHTIRSEETPAFSELLTKVGVISDEATKLIGDVNKDINRISGGADTLLGNLNDVTGPRNRQSISSALDGANGMIANTNGLISRSSPKIDAITSNLQSGSEKINHLTASIDDAITKMSKLLENADSTVTENGPQLKKDLEDVESTLADIRKVLAVTNAMLDSNRNDINTTIDEIRRSSVNLRDFTETVKQRPFSLVRVKAQPDRKVPK